jgi:cephalosporin hydroxylase
MKKTKDIEGWFNYEKTYDFLLSKINDGGTFVECGAWLGKSSSYLCDCAKDRINVFVVDSWLGSDNEINTSHALAVEKDIYDIFLENMGNRIFKPIRKLSKEAAIDFKDGGCDIVFIDMNHSYESVLEDINIWLPKVKIGGYLAGHDYNIVDWPFVVRAVNENFATKDLTIIGDCWIYHKK